jgi:hypothetical protein
MTQALFRPVALFLALTAVNVIWAATLSMAVA